MSTVIKIQPLHEFEAETLATVLPFKSSFGGVMFKDIGQHRARYEWLVKGMIAAREVSFLAGPSQSGKSFFATDLAFHIARGQAFWGRKVRQGAVIYIAAESGTGVVALRLPAYAQDRDIPPDTDIPILTLVRSPNFFSDEEGVKKLIAEILAYEKYIGIKVEMVVVDTFSAASAGADEIKSQSVSVVRTRFKQIVDECKAAVLVVHHMNGSGDRVRGHSSLTSDADGVLLVNWDREQSGNPKYPGEIRKDADGRDVRIVTSMKVKEGANNVRIKFVLRQVVLGRDDDGDPITSCVVTTANEAEVARTASERRAWSPSPTERRIVTHLFQALRRHGFLATKEHLEKYNIPPGTEIVEWAHYREIAKSLTMDGEEAGRKADAIRMEFKRGQDKLLNAGVLGVARPYLWWAGRPVKGVSYFTKPADTPRTAPGHHPNDSSSETFSEQDETGW